MRRNAASALARRTGSSDRQDRIAVSRRAATCGLVGSRVSTISHDEIVARAVGAVELRRVGAEPADQRPHPVGIGERERMVRHQAAHALQRPAFGDLRLQGEPFVENERFGGEAAREGLERVLAPRARNGRRSSPARRAAPSCCRPRRTGDARARRLRPPRPATNIASAPLRRARRPALAASGLKAAASAIASCNAIKLAAWARPSAPRRFSRAR